MFYQPVQHQRFFHSRQLYLKIDWQDFHAVVDAFRKKLDEWYLAPAEMLRPNWDHAFALMAMNCLLIDALSQYYYGKRASARSVFKKFACRKLPEFRGKLPIPIQERPVRRKRRKASTPRRKPVKPRLLKTFADVLYVAFRCGILHEAHVSLCAGLAGLSGKMCDLDPDICTTYRDGSPCPTVRMDPHAIYDELKKVIDQYLADLADPDPRQDVRRRHF